MYVIFDFGLEWFVRIVPEWFNCQPPGCYSKKPRQGHSLSGLHCGFPAMV